MRISSRTLAQVCQAENCQDGNSVIRMFTYTFSGIAFSG